MEEKRSLFELMLVELESYTSQARSKEPSMCVELELRKLQLILIPYLRLSDALKEKGEVASKEILRFGHSIITVQDIHDTQRMFDRLDVLCTHVRELECQKKTT